MSLITIGSSQINFISGNSTVSSIYSSGSNLYLNTNSGNFYCSNLSFDNFTTNTLTYTYINGVNVLVTNTTLTNISPTNITCTNLLTTATTVSNLNANSVLKASQTLVGSTTTASTLYQMTSTDLGLLILYWQNGYAILSYSNVQGTSSSSMIQLANSAAGHAISFNVQPTSSLIQSTCVDSATIRFQQLKIL